MTKGQVTNGPASPGQEVWIGKMDKSTSPSLITTSWQGAERLTLGEIFSTLL